MDTSFVERLKKRAATMLPAATVMLVECAGDASGDPKLTALLDEIQQKGLHDRPLCDEPCRAVVFDDRVLLRCGGCPRQKELPQVAGIGRGRTAGEARQNALYALTMPLNRTNARRKGCLAAQTYGEGPVEDVQQTCILNRVAYRDPIG